MKKIIDLRSDTVTKPTDAMRNAMRDAIVGDDVYHDDPTVIELETLAAKLLGKEKALFVPSGTMGNQISIFANTQRGDEIILQKNHHIFKYEVGAISVLSSVQANIIQGHDGEYDLEVLADTIRDKNNIHCPSTRIICMENTHNMEGGKCVSLEHMKAVYELAKENDLLVHLDGARIFNAATAMDVSVSEIAQYADTVMFCLSKGLASPVGSMVAGDSAFIERARKARKLLGGGMRQVGVLASCGLISLKDMVMRLSDDHKRAKKLAKALNEMDFFEVNLDNTDTNIVIAKVVGDKYTVASITKRLEEEGILISYGAKKDEARFVTHLDISESDIDKTIKIVSAL